MSDYDVVIAGYGPTGAVAANLLGAHGVSVLVVELRETIYDIPRAVHFDGEVMRIFQSMGLAEEMSSLSAAVTEVTFVNGWNWTLLWADLRKTPRRHGWENGNFFNQPQLEQHLRRNVARFPSVEVRLGWACESFVQDPDGVDITLRRIVDDQTETLRAGYLLGSDGANSPVRRRLNIESEDLHCDEPWLVCDLMLDEVQNYGHGAFQICDPKRPTTVIHCEGSHIRWEFMLRPDDDPDALEQEATARAMMAPHIQRLGAGLSSERGELVRSKVYQFHALVAESFQDRRVFLLGDAAHQTPPFLGQGMCAGIRDAYNLCWKLQGVIHGSYDASVLDSYATERRLHVREVVAQAVNIGGIIQTTNRWRAFARDLVLLLGRVVPALAPPLHIAPSWSVGPGLFAQDQSPLTHAATGRLIDQPMVETNDTGPTRFDEILGNGFTVIGFGVNLEDLLDASAARSCEELAARCIEVGPNAPMRDLDNQLASWLDRVGGGRVVVLRPDRQVYGVFDGDTDAALAEQLCTGLTDLAHRLLA